MDTNSTDKKPRSQRLPGFIGRPLLLVSALTIVMLAIAVACGGGDDSGGDEEDRPTYAIQTFTPTVPGSTPDAPVTEEARQEARRTESANTATAVAGDPNNAPPTMTPGGPLDGVEGFRPPEVTLTDGENQMGGVLGSFAMADEESQTYPVIQAPFYDVGENGLTVAPGGQLEFSFVEDAEVAPASEVNVSIYDWENNNAIPTDTEGVIGTHPIFAARVEPVSTETFPNANPTFSMPDEPGRYVVMVEVHWPQDERVSPQLPSPFATYAFTVYVE